MINISMQKNANKYICNICDFKCNKKSDYNRHILTRKHKILINTDEKSVFTPYYCLCGKSYKHSQSLYNHKKKCKYFVKKDENIEENLKKNIEENFTKNNEENNEVNNEVNTKEINYKELVIKLIDENKELKNTIMMQNSELQKTILHHYCIF